MEQTERRWFFIVNPAAGNGAVRKRLPAITARLEQGLPGGFRMALTEYRGHAVLLTQEALRQGFRCIAAVGGDGTNNEVVNGLMEQSEVPLSQITYTLLPVGTGNDWIRSHGIPRRIEQWLEMAVGGRIVEQDVGVLRYQHEGATRRRFFVNVAGLAYDAFVVQYAEQRKSLVAGKLMYLVLILTCLFRYKLSKATVRFNGQEESDRYYTINGGICRYSGGGMQIVPHADPADGLIALTLAGSLSKIGVLLNTWRFYNASIGRHPKVKLYQAARIEVDSADGKPIPVEADGEFLGYTPVELYLASEKLRVLTPMNVPLS
jgi:diacylglycerol kinase (ATP)